MPSVRFSRCTDTAPSALPPTSRRANTAHRPADTLLPVKIPVVCLGQAQNLGPRDGPADRSAFPWYPFSSGPGIEFDKLQTEYCIHAQHLGQQADIVPQAGPCAAVIQLVGKNRSAGCRAGQSFKKSMLSYSRTPRSMLNTAAHNWSAGGGAARPAMHLACENWGRSSMTCAWLSHSSRLPSAFLKAQSIFSMFSTFQRAARR